MTLSAPAGCPPGITREIRANRLATYVSAALFIATLIVGLQLDSVTLMLSSTSWFVNVVAGVFLEKIIIAVDRAPDDDFHFGYTKCEPLVAMATGLVILGSCILTVKFAIQDLMNPDPPGDYRFGVAVAVISGIVGLAVMLHLQRVGKACRSIIIKTLALDWRIDSLLSFGVCAGFVIAMLMVKAGFGAQSDHVDPIMALVLAVVLSISPLRLIRENVRELLDASPGEPIGHEVAAVAEEFRQRFPAHGVHRIRLRKAGRKVFVEVQYLAAPNRTLGEIDRFTRELRAHVVQRFDQPVDVTVGFSMADVQPAAANAPGMATVKAAKA